MRVALVHEFLTQVGGAERVLQTFHKLFPAAPVYTLVYDEVKTGGVFEGFDIRTSFLQKIPGVARHPKWSLPLMPRAIESFDFSGYDLVLSDSSAFAKGVITKKPTVHICYCHTPTRYLWESMDEYVTSLPYPWFIKRMVRPYLKYHLRGWDYAAAQRPDFLIANSQTVQGRIKKYYDREAQVIYPPVDTSFFHPGAEKKDYFFTASRLEPYKKIDLVIAAFAELGLPLKVAGEGTQLEKFKVENSKFKNIKFFGRVSDEELRELYSGARAFVFPAYEDAGIMVLEALSCDTPVIGLSKGGTAEFIRDGENGTLFAEQTVEAIIEAVRRFMNLTSDAKNLRNQVLAFDKNRFREKVINFIDDKMSFRT